MLYIAIRNKAVSVFQSTFVISVSALEVWQHLEQIEDSKREVGFPPALHWLF